jgi:hypothetical protein
MKPAIAMHNLPHPYNLVRFYQKNIGGMLLITKIFNKIIPNKRESEIRPRPDATSLRVINPAHYLFQLIWFRFSKSYDG